MSNTILVLDMVVGTLNVMARLNDLLQKAAIENRDVSGAELAALKAENDAAEQAFLNK